jgi:hypothetical protein
VQFYGEMALLGAHLDLTELRRQSTAHVVVYCERYVVSPHGVTPELFGHVVRRFQQACPFGPVMSGKWRARLDSNQRPPA